MNSSITVILLRDTILYEALWAQGQSQFVPVLLPDIRPCFVTSFETVTFLISNNVSPLN